MQTKTHKQYTQQSETAFRRNLAFFVFLSFSNFCYLPPALFFFLG